MATTASSLRVTRLAGALGARVEGLDLNNPQNTDTLAELRQLFLQHLVLVFPNQGHITPEQHIAFAAQWGELQYSKAPGVDGRTSLVELATGGAPRQPLDPDMHEMQKLARVDVWHSDQSFEPCPPVGSFLIARQLPPAGGDTMFANQYLAYDALSKPLQDMLKGLRALHSGEGFNRALGLDPKDATRNLHPVVRAHPETGKPALYVNRIWTRRIEGLTDAESRVLLEFLYEHAVQPEFTFRHTWTVGDMLMWDNRCAQHYAIRDYDARRVMHRATVLGDRPIAA